MVKLLAEVLYAGKGCPVCGEHKTEKARTCRTCFETIGFEATKAVDAVIETIAKAAEGNEASTKGAFKREVVFGSIFAQVKIDKNAQLHKAMGNIQAYWDCEKSIPGGFVSAYVFGAEETQKGTMVTAIIDFKNKEHRPSDIVHYVRAQAAHSQLSSDIKLAIVRQEESGTLIPEFPIKLIEEQYEKKGEKITRRYAIGFQYVDKAARLVTENPELASLMDVAMNNHQTEACAG